MQSQYAAALARYRRRPYTVRCPVYSRNLCGLQVGNLSFFPLSLVGDSFRNSAPSVLYYSKRDACLFMAAGRGPPLQPDTFRITATALTGLIQVVDPQRTTTRRPVTMPDCNNRQLKDGLILKGSYWLLIIEAMMAS